MQTLERDKILKAYEVVKTSRLTPEQHEAFAVIFDNIANFMEENTRPAPAATDTGLVTVATVWPEGELVTRSQAESIIAAKDADIAELVHDLNRTKDHETELVNDCVVLEAKLAAAEKALEFYANRENWKNGRFEQAEGGTVLRHHPSSVHKDRGAKARAVLGGNLS